MMRSRPALIGAVAVLVLPRAAAACAVCFGAGDHAMTHGMNNGILALLGVVVLVQIGFAALFLSIRSRARRLQRRRDSFEVIEGGSAR